MRLTDRQHRELAELAADVDAAGHGAKRALVAGFAAREGVTAATVYRRLRAIRKPDRARRRDRDRPRTDETTLRVIARYKEATRTTDERTGVERVAPTDQTVLIYGESGTGKELVAKAIHAYSRRKGDRFLAVNCAALPEPLLESEMFGHVKGAFTGASTDKKGLFEAVAGGTLLLDEIGSMPAGIQGKLLRVLQEKEVRKVGGNDTITVDCRVLAATNTPLEERMKSGSFREDLFYRLSVISITIDPLRNRRADILPLAHHIIRAELGEGRPLPEIAPRAAAILEGYAWPGNVRELENAIKHALTFSTEDRITPDVLPPKIATGADAELFGRDLQDELSIVPLKSFLREKEEKYVEQVLAQLNGDKEKAAALLGISLATLYRKIPADRSPATAT